MIGGWNDARKNDAIDETKNIFNAVGCDASIAEVFIPYSRTTFAKVKLNFPQPEAHISARRQFQFNILDKLIAKNFTSHIPGSVGNKIWSTKSKTPEERAKIRAIVLTKTFYRNPTPGEGKPCFGEDAIEISWNGNVGDPPAYDTRGADPSPDPDGGNDDGNPPRKPGKGPDPDPPDGDDPDGGDDPEVTEVKISRREADKVVVPSFPTVPHLDNWMALWCMC